jgi:enediyne biosynthesis protein E3
LSSTLGKLLKPLIGVSHKAATSFSEGNSDAWRCLERSVLAAIEGYHATLDDSRLEVLIPRLNTIELDLRGFAYEGAAMGLTGLDCMLPGKNRLQAYLAGAGGAHIYMVHIGAGEALARLRRKPERYLSRLDPVLCWLALDGYGFHEGFFKQRRFIEGQAFPAHLSAYGRRIFDQGLGRAIWFLKGANVERVVAAVNTFPPSRQGDLWCGVGVCSAYAGGIDLAEARHLQQAAGQYAPHLALGAAVVAKGRQRASNPTYHSDMACEVFCGTTSDIAASYTDRAFEDLPLDADEPAYEILQQRLLARFTVPIEQASQRKEVV